MTALDVAAFRKRLFGTGAREAACNIVGVVLGLGSMWASSAITQWVSAPFLARLETFSFTVEEWGALTIRAEILALLVLIGFAGSLSRIHPLVGRVLSWVSFFAALNLLGCLVDFVS